MLAKLAALPSPDGTIAAWSARIAGAPGLEAVLARAQGKRARLIPVPAGLLRLAAKVLGKRDIAQRLLSPLQVDITETRRVLGWQPPIRVDEALRAAVAASEEGNTR